MMARMTPVSLHFSDVPTGWEKKSLQTNNSWLLVLHVRHETVSPDEHCYRLICASCTQFHVPLGTQSLPAPTSFYTQTVLHTDASTRRCVLHTHTRFHTQTLLHTDALTHKRFYTQTLLHTDAFTHRRFYTQKLLHTDGFTHRRFYTQMRFTHAHTLSHTNTFTHRRADTQFAFFSSVFDVQRPFRA